MCRDGQRRASLASGCVAALHHSRQNDTQYLVPINDQAHQCHCQNPIQHPQCQSVCINDELEKAATKRLSRPPSWDGNRMECTNHEVLESVPLSGLETVDFPFIWTRDRRLRRRSKTCFSGSIIFVNFPLTLERLSPMRNPWNLVELLIKYVS